MLLRLLLLLLSGPALVSCALNPGFQNPWATPSNPSPSRTSPLSQPSERTSRLTTADYPTYPTAPATPTYPSYPAYPGALSVPIMATAAPAFDTDTATGTALPGGARYHDFSTTVGDRKIRLNVVLFKASQYQLKVIDQPGEQRGGSVIATLLPQHGAVAGVNGGFFTLGFQPIGLMIANGKTAGQFAQGSLTSGVIQQRGGKIELIWSKQHPGAAASGVRELLQAGPRLVDNTQAIKGLEASKQRARTFIATDGRDAWMLGTTNACSLAELAQLLASPDLLPGWRSWRALNLDGGNSTALWLRTAAGETISKPGWSTVRNYIAIVPR